MYVPDGTVYSAGLGAVGGDVAYATPGLGMTVGVAPVQAVNTLVQSVPLEAQDIAYNSKGLVEQQALVMEQPVVVQPQPVVVEQPVIVEPPPVIVEPQPVIVEPPPVVSQVIQPTRDDLSKYYAICDAAGLCEPDDDFRTDGWKQFYPLNDPFFTYPKGPTYPNYMVYNPEDPVNLAIYEGEMRGGLKHGFGRLTTPRYVRLGNWRDDRFTGWGRESRRNGDILEGRFEEGRVFGKGILKNRKGNLYVGDFKNSRRDGLGDLDTNRIHYKGQFMDDRLNGKGIIHFKVEGHDYDGDFRDNEITGRGVFKWTNGDMYEGEMLRGKMHGLGTYTYANGQIYEGSYVNGVKEGRGRLHYRNGTIFDGLFVAGQPAGQASIIEGGRTVPVQFNNGAFYQI